MGFRTTFVVGASIVLLFAGVSHAEIQTVAECNGNETATPDFQFTNVPPPSRNDAATIAKFTIVDGRSDPNGGDVETLRSVATQTYPDPWRVAWFARILDPMAAARFALEVPEPDGIGLRRYLAKAREAPEPVIRAMRLAIARSPEIEAEGRRARAAALALCDQFERAALDIAWGEDTDEA